MSLINNLRLSARFNLILALIFIALLTANVIDDFLRQQSLVLRDSIDTSRLMARQLVETRAYLSSSLKQETRTNENLIPQVAATRIAKRISDGTGYTLRQVSLRYRNPQNSPDPYEASQLRDFSTRPVKEHHRVITVNAKRLLRYMLPMTAEASCLECHGSFEAAPDYIQKRFPKGHFSYGYNVGEVIGAVSVTIPMSELYKTITYNLSKDFGVIGVIALLIILLIRGLISRYILTPITRLSETINKVALTGNFSEQLTVSGKDEVSHLITAYNAMMEELERKSVQRRESEERYRNVIEMARSAFITFIDDGKIVIVNRSAEQLLGLPREDLIGISFFSFLVNGEKLQQEIENRLGSDRTWTGTTFTFALKNIRGDSREVEIALSATLSEGRHMFTAIIRDPLSDQT